MFKDELGRPSKLSIVIPAYNEEKRIGEALDRILMYFEAGDPQYIEDCGDRKYQCVGLDEIIVVDDGSTDRTCNVVEAKARCAGGQPTGGSGTRIRLLKNDVNRGKGFSVKRGMLAAEGDFILFSDADLSTPIEEINKLIHWLSQGYDVAIGSRAMAESRITVSQPLHRRVMGRIFNGLVGLATVRGIRDTQCGFKVFTRDAAQALFPLQRLDGFAFDVEILYLAQCLGFTIKEVPVEWRNAPGTKVRVGVDSVLMFFDLLKILMDRERKETFKSAMVSTGIEAFFKILHSFCGCHRGWPGGLS